MTSDELKKIDKELIWHPFAPLISPFETIPIQSAKGVNLRTVTGDTIIDAISSWWVNIHGHANEEIANAIYKQAKTLEHVIFAGFTHEPAVKLAKNLMTILPDGFAKIFFSDDGSTSIEVALKTVIQYWHNKGEQKRKKIIALAGAYHGDTFGAMAVGERGSFFEPFSSLLFDVDFIDFPTENNFAQVLIKLDQLTSKADCAGFIFEPLVQGAGGMRMYTPDHLDQMVKLVQSKGLLCIADEVMTGFGRTGTNFATDQIDASPDIVCMSKGLTGGTMAMGITACNQKIVEAFNSPDFAKALLHGHSYTGNPLACAAANASFDIFRSVACRGNIARINERHEAYADLVRKSPAVENVRVRGTILAFDLKGFGETGYESEARKKIYPYFLKKGILIRPLGNVIYLMPPYIISDDELNYIYKSFDEFLELLNPT